MTTLQQYYDIYIKFKDKIEFGIVYNREEHPYKNSKEWFKFDNQITV